MNAVEGRLMDERSYDASTTGMLRAVSLGSRLMAVDRLNCRHLLMVLRALGVDASRATVEMEALQVGQRLFRPAFGSGASAPLGFDLPAQSALQARRAASPLSLGGAQ